MDFMFDLMADIFAKIMAKSSKSEKNTFCSRKENTILDLFVGHERWEIVHEKQNGEYREKECI